MNRKSLLLSLGFMLAGFFVFAQNQERQSALTVAVSQEEVLLGNYIEVTFNLENAQGGKFSPPDWEAAGFVVRGGPNQSSQISMINGQTKSSLSYSYYVEPRDTGVYTIPQVTVSQGDHVWKSDPVIVKVFPNPNGIIETPQRKMRNNPFWERMEEPQPEPSIKPKKKRNTTKI